MKYYANDDYKIKVTYSNKDETLNKLNDFIISFIMENISKVEVSNNEQ